MATGTGDRGAADRTGQQHRSAAAGGCGSVAPTGVGCVMRTRKPEHPLALAACSFQCALVMGRLCLLPLSMNQLVKSGPLLFGGRFNLNQPADPRPAEGTFYSAWPGQTTDTCRVNRMKDSYQPRWRRPGMGRSGKCRSTEPALDIHRWNSLQARLRHHAVSFITELKCWPDLARNCLAPHAHLGEKPCAVLGAASNQYTGRSRLR